MIRNSYFRRYVHSNCHKTSAAVKANDKIIAMQYITMFVAQSVKITAETKTDKTHST